MTSTTRKILVVDDDRSSRACLTHVLEGDGYTVVSAVGGADALERLRTEASLPSLILHSMPSTEGLQFWAEITRTGTWADVPIVVIIPHVQFAAHAAAMGAVASQAAPFRPCELRSLVAQVIATKG